MKDSSSADNTSSQHQLIRDQFSKQAEGWGKRHDNLAEAAAALDLQPRFTVLDVASGSGLLAQAIAPHVRRIVSADITPEMLQQARLKGILNHSFVLAAAESLPHATGTFDRVVTRYSLHHIRDPEPVLHEMQRVCRSGGRAMVIDIVSPEDTDIADRYNHLERLRDPSHTTALSLSAFETLFTGVGFRLKQRSVNPLGAMDVENWFDLSQTPDPARQEVLAAFQAELDGGRATGFNPFYRQGRLKVVHPVVSLIGVKD